MSSPGESWSVALSCPPAFEKAMICSKPLGRYVKLPVLAGEVNFFRSEIQVVVLRCVPKPKPILATFPCISENVVEGLCPSVVGAVVELDEVVLWLDLELVISERPGEPGGVISTRLGIGQQRSEIRGFHVEADSG